MKVLQLCSKVPYPAKDGGCLAMLNLADMMHNSGFKVKILAIETHKHPAPVNGYPSDFEKKFEPESVYIETKTSIFKALFNLLFTHESYHLSRFKHPNFTNKLIEILKSHKPDIVVLDSLFTAGYIHEIRAYSKAKIIYRAHNIEFLIWQEIGQNTSSFFRKYYLKLQSSRLQSEEMQLIQSCQAILAITIKDFDFFSNHFAQKQAMILPFTVDLRQYVTRQNLNQKAIFFIGAMDWYPNLEGVKWFINQVWDAVLKQHPDAVFYIAGKAMPEELKNLNQKNIINLGEVPDARKFMENYPMMVAPIFSGGGLKIKIIEGMAMGKIVVCNAQAASGIPVSDKVNILLAESSKDFIDIINDCFKNLMQKSDIGKNARLLIDDYFNTEKKSEELALFMKSLNHLN